MQDYVISSFRCSDGMCLWDHGIIPIGLKWISHSHNPLTTQCGILHSYYFLKILLPVYHFVSVMLSHKACGNDTVPPPPPHSWPHIIHHRSKLLTCLCSATSHSRRLAAVAAPLVSACSLHERQVRPSLIDPSQLPF